MKKIIKPAEDEEAVYFSDFSGRSLGEYGPPVELKIIFNYGSKQDGDCIQLDLDDSDIQEILKIIKNSVTEEFKNKSQQYKYLQSNKAA